VSYSYVKTKGAPPSKNEGSPVFFYESVNTIRHGWPVARLHAVYFVLRYRNPYALLNAPYAAIF